MRKISGHPEVAKKIPPPAARRFVSEILHLIYGAIVGAYYGPVLHAPAREVHA